MEPGIYDGLTHADLPPGLSASGAKKILFKSPAVYQYEREHPRPKTKAMVLGTLAHQLILEGKTGYLVCRDGRTKEGKADKARIEDEGLIAVTQAEADDIEGMAKAILEHELAASILGDGKSEQAVVWTDEQTGVTCRGFVDWLHPKVIADLKSCQDGSQDGFGKQAANLGYDIQSFMYREAIRQLTGEDLPFLHITVESKAPYLVAVHQLPVEADQRGERLFRKALDIYAKCIDTGIWPGYSEQIIDTTWPKWAA